MLKIENHRNYCREYYKRNKKKILDRCNKCHAQTQYNRSDWVRYFKNVMEAIKNA